MRQIIHDDDRSAEARIAVLKELLPKEEKSQPNSPALVRQSLTNDATRVTALLNSFSDLDLKGHADQRPMKQVVALREPDRARCQGTAGGLRRRHCRSCLARPAQ